MLTGVSNDCKISVLNDCGRGFLHAHVDRTFISFDRRCLIDGFFLSSQIMTSFAAPFPASATPPRQIAVWGKEVYIAFNVSAPFPRNGPPPFIQPDRPDMLHWLQGTRLALAWFPSPTVSDTDVWRDSISYYSPSGKMEYEEEINNMYRLAEAGTIRQQEGYLKKMIGALRSSLQPVFEQTPALWAYGLFSARQPSEPALGKAYYSSGLKQSVAEWWLQGRIHFHEQFSILGFLLHLVDVNPNVRATTMHRISQADGSVRYREFTQLVMSIHGSSRLPRTGIFVDPSPMSLENLDLLLRLSTKANCVPIWFLWGKLTEAASERGGSLQITAEDIDLRSDSLTRVGAIYRHAYLGSPVLRVRNSLPDSLRWGGAPPLNDRSQGWPSSNAWGSNADDAPSQAWGSASSSAWGSASSSAWGSATSNSDSTPCGAWGSASPDAWGTPPTPAIAPTAPQSSTESNWDNPRQPCGPHRSDRARAQRSGRGRARGPSSRGRAAHTLGHSTQPSTAEGKPQYTYPIHNVGLYPLPDFQF